MDELQDIIYWLESHESLKEMLAYLDYLEESDYAN